MGLVGTMVGGARRDYKQHSMLRTESIKLVKLDKAAFLFIQDQINGEGKGIFFMWVAVN